MAYKRRPIYGYKYAQVYIYTKPDLCKNKGIRVNPIHSFSFVYMFRIPVGSLAVFHRVYCVTGAWWQHITVRIAWLLYKMT